MKNNKRSLEKWYHVEQLGGKCLICGESRSPSIIDFHHINESTKNPILKEGNGTGGGIFMALSIPEREKEIKLCVPLCRCDHAMFHAGELVVNSTLYNPLKSVDHFSDIIKWEKRRCYCGTYYECSDKSSLKNCQWCFVRIKKEEFRKFGNPIVNKILGKKYENEPVSCPYFVFEK